MSLILGLNAFHGDSSACLLRDGEIVAAVEEERLNRIKHWSGFPAQAIRYCLNEAGASLSDLDHIAINRDPSANKWRRAAYVLRKRPSLGLIFKRLGNIHRVNSLQAEFAKAFSNESLNAQWHQIEHHEAHLASAFMVSDFQEALCLSVDGFGDFSSSAWGMGRSGKMDIDGRVYFPHSLGVFYSAITQFIGFPHYGDEYKVMGLAPYGEPKYLNQMREIVRLKSDGRFELNLKYFRHHREDVHYTWDSCAPEIGTLYSPALKELLGEERPEKGMALEQRHMDLARSAQAMYEETFFAMLETFHGRYGCDNLALSGGCAMNSVANGKIYLRSPFKRMYLPAAAGDAGGSVGSAYVVHHRVSADTKVHHMASAYVGPQASDDEIGKLLADRKADIDAANCTVRKIDDEAELCRETAQAISEGGIIGWFQGRLEWGPRALGNRSILGDPRRADMKEILNLKIKRRESFRPFAPSILREEVANWFEQEDDVPFMMQVFQFREDKRALVPAVCHADNSGRLQTVHADTNPRYHRLISAFKEITGVPLLLNTSFNENEPVVCRPVEALDCFLRTKMDLLVLGEHMIRRSADRTAADETSGD
jgi:carbamoyltransferase